MIRNPLPADRTVDGAEMITGPPPHGPAPSRRQALLAARPGLGLHEEKTLSKKETMVNSLQFLQPLEVDGGVGILSLTFQFQYILFKNIYFCDNRASERFGVN